MRILVIGAGALGSLIGGLLSVDHDVTIIGRPEQAWVLKEKGLKIEGITEGEFRPKAHSGVPKDQQFDLIILCVKSYNTELSLDPLTPLLMLGTPILSMQNGNGAKPIPLHMFLFWFILQIWRKNLLKVLWSMI